MKKEIEKICAAHKFFVDFKKSMTRNSTRNEKVKEFQEIIGKHYDAFFEIDQFYIFCLKDN